MEGLEVLSPDFIEISIKSLPLSDVLNLIDTNKTWRNWAERNMNYIADEYGYPRVKSISELIDYTWLSANKLLRKGCKDGNMKVVKNALKKNACQLTICGYYAAKHGHLEIVNLLRELGADDDKLIEGAVRGDQLEILKTFDLKDVEVKQHLINFSMTTETSKVRDWLRDNGYDPPTSIDIGLYLNEYEQSFIQLPQYILYYAHFIAKTKIEKTRKEGIWINQIFVPESYQVLFYVFARFDYSEIEGFLRTNAMLCFNVRTLRYCFSHNKYVDLIIRTYDTLKEDILSVALRYRRFDVVDWVMARDPSDKGEVYFKNAKEIMKFAVRDYRIFTYLEKKFQSRGGIPILSGLAIALERDRPKMFQYLFNRVGNVSEAFILSLPEFPASRVIQSIETMGMLHNLGFQILFGKDLYKYTSYFNEFLNNIIYRSMFIDLPFIKYLVEIEKHDNDFDDFDRKFPPKVEAYLNGI